jgi:GMP synthase (glutamine-hydrolysing)
LGQLADRGFPTFASCFGFQGLVLALGGQIIHDDDNAEVGSFDLKPTKAAATDPIFKSLPAQFVAQQGHKDRASTLPSGVVNLASSARCPFQAIRVADSPVYATQFHPELTDVGNQKRFSRYFDMYSKAFGHSQAQSMLDAFRPSPEANTLLRDFVSSL